MLGFGAIGAAGLGGRRSGSGVLRAPLGKRETTRRGGGTGAVGGGPPSLSAKPLFLFGLLTPFLLPLPPLGFSAPHRSYNMNQ